MRRPTIFLMLAVVAAFLAAVVVFSALRNREAAMRKAMADRVDIVVAARDIPIGVKLEPSMVKLAHWASDSVPQGAFTDPMAVANGYARTQFVAGEPIVKQRIFVGGQANAVMPLLIPPGMRAMSVPVDDVSDIAGFVKPHTRVDVLVALSGRGPKGNPFSKIVLQDVPVVAAAQEIDPGKDAPKVVKVVTLLVTPHQAEKLALASREGTLRLAMRNYTDRKLVATTGSDIPDLLGRGAAGPAIRSQAAGASGGRARVRGTHHYSIEIMRNGTKVETVAFVNEAMAGAHPTSRHPSGWSVGEIRRPARHAASEHALGAAQAVLPSAPKGGPSIKAAGYVPIPKKIDVP